MRQFRKIALGQKMPDAVTVGIERGVDGQPVASVWWPARGDVEAGEARYSAVPEALEAALAAKTLHGFSGVAIMLQSDDLWRRDWGQLLPEGNRLTEAESYELARATEASRDA